MDSQPNTVKPLQFDTAIPGVPADTGSHQQGVTCVACQRTILDKYFDVNGQSVCESCRNEIAQHAETPRGLGVLARACLFGLVAAILGAILYYAVIAITNFEIGLVAIAIGYMVGYGVRMGTRGRGGRRFQVMALVLTYWAVGLAYTPFLFSELSKQDATQQASTNATASVDAAVTPDASEAADAADAADAPGALALPLALAVLLAISFALPVLTVVGSMPGGLISAAIIAFGMHQAWRMTARASTRDHGAVSHRRQSPGRRPEIVVLDLTQTPRSQVRAVRAPSCRRTRLRARACSTLVHRERLQQLAAARREPRRAPDDPATARAHWTRRTRDSFRPRPNSIN